MIGRFELVVDQKVAVPPLLPFQLPLLFTLDQIRSFVISPNPLYSNQVVC
jgi:hypothetical protein